MKKAGILVGWEYKWDIEYSLNLLSRIFKKYLIFLKKVLNSFFYFNCLIDSLFNKVIYNIIEILFTKTYYLFISKYFFNN